MKKVLIAFVVIISMTQQTVTSPFCDTDTAIARLLSHIESPDATNEIEKHKILCFARIFAILLHPQRQATPQQSKASFNSFGLHFHCIVKRKERNCKIIIKIEL